MSNIEPFGFTVEKTTRYDYDLGEEIPGYWRVKLPHQCDSWDIAGADYGDSATHAEAVTALEAFIAEAQQALEALEAEREFPAASSTSEEPA